MKCAHMTSVEKRPACAKEVNGKGEKPGSINFFGIENEQLKCLHFCMIDL